MKQSKISIPGVTEIQESLFAGTPDEVKYFTAFPEVKRDEKSFVQILESFDPKKGLGLDYEFEIKTHKPTIIGISSETDICSLPATEKLTRLAYEAARDRKSTFVGYSVFGAEKPIIDAVVGETSVDMWDDGLRSFFLANSVLCKSAKDDTDEGGSLGFMGLNTAATFYLNIPVWKICRGATCYGPCPYHRVFDYNGIDAWAGLLVHHAALNDFYSKGGTYKTYRQKMHTGESCYEMERAGILANRQNIENLDRRITDKKERLFEGTGFNPRSGPEIINKAKSLGRIIEKSDIKQIQKSCEKEFKTLGYGSIKDFEAIHGEGQEDFDPEFVARKIERFDAKNAEIAAFFYRMYKYKKSGKGTKSWFDDKYFNGSWLHPRFNDTGTSLGRLSSSKPNFQNVPRTGFGEEIRKCIIPPEGFDIVKMDFSNLELRIILWKAGFDVTTILKHDPFQWLVDNSNGLFDSVATKMNTGFSPRDWSKSVSHACLRGDQEILTTEGWIPIAKWNNQQIAVWDNGNIFFELPEKYHTYPFEGMLNKISSNKVSTVTTPNHKFPILTSGTWNGNIYTKNHRCEFSEFPMSGRLPINGELINTPNNKYTDADIIRAVAVQADGSLAGKKVKFHVVKDRKKIRLEYYFGPMQPCKCAAHKGFSGYYDFSSPLINDKKEFTWEVLSLDERQRKIFLDELLLWDGNVTGYRKRYDTTSRQSAEVVHTLAMLSGIGSLLTYSEGCKLYTVSFNKFRYTSVSSLKCEQIYHTGKVYCFTTSTGYFLVRHKDKISVTGNSNLLEGFTLLSKTDLAKPHTQKLITNGALRVFYDWIFRGKTVAFTGANLAERLLGSKTEANRKAMLELQWDIYFKSFPILNDFHRKLLAEIENEKVFRVPGGMILDLYGPDLDDAKISAAAVGQGGGAAFVQEAMSRFRLKTGLKFFCQVHDDVNVLFPESTPDGEIVDIMKVMVEPSDLLPGMICPAKILRGKNWAESDMKNLGKIY